jgi:hypothetical protein
MKHLKKIARVCGLIIFLILAVAGIGIIGIAPALNKDNKLFADEGSKIEMVEENIAEVTREEKLKA